MKILAISGSLRAASHNTALLHAGAEMLPVGVALDLYPDLELLSPDNEDRDSDDPPLELAWLREAIAAERFDTEGGLPHPETRELPAELVPGGVDNPRQFAIVTAG